jgi:electron transfer flavoprotein alpha subunit
LQTGLTADCTGLDIDSDGNLIQIRPTYGGNIIASIISPNHRPQLASVRPNVFAVRPAKPQGNLTLYKESIEPEHLEDRVRLVKSEEKEDAYRDVTEADILIVGGYGVGSKENFQKLEKLAIRMNAAIGATRKAVDEGWAPADVQVGQTGKTVAPSLYIGCGVSGALQHTIGMKNAKTIITINNNPAAPIFAMSDVAILGDCVEVCEALCERIEAIRR